MLTCLLLAVLQVCADAALAMALASAAEPAPNASRPTAARAARAVAMQFGKVRSYGIFFVRFMGHKHCLWWSCPGCLKPRRRLGCRMPRWNAIIAQDYDASSAAVGNCEL